MYSSGAGIKAQNNSHTPHKTAFRETRAARTVQGLELSRALEANGEQTGLHTTTPLPDNIFFSPTANTNPKRAHAKTQKKKQHQLVNPCCFVLQTTTATRGRTSNRKNKPYMRRHTAQQS